MIIDVIDLNINNLNFSKRYDTARNKRAKTIYRYENVDIEQVEERKDGTYKGKGYLKEMTLIYPELTTNLSKPKKFIPIRQISTDES